MCGRYLIKRKTLKKLSEVLEIPLIEDFEEGEINPGGKAIVLSSDRSFIASDWGYSNPYDKKLIINARSETISEKPMFRNDFRNNRCLVPADMFFEWTADKKKTGFFLNDRSFFMAAVFRQKSNRKEMVILTKEASDDIKHIHPRSPVIVPYKCIFEWLNDYQTAVSVISQENPKFSLQME